MMSRSGLLAPLRLLRAQRDLRLLVAAGLVSMSGDWILSTGIAFSVYELTGSTLASAGVLLAACLPQLLAGPIAGVLVDRWDRSRTIVVANLAMAAGLTPLLWVHDAGLVWLVYVVLAGQSVAEVFVAPAEQALLPRVVQDDDLLAANAVNGQAADLARLLGGAAGGVAAAAGGIPLVALLDAATFLAAAALMRAVRTGGRAVGAPADDAAAGAPGPSAETAVRRRLTRLRGELADGWTAARTEPVVRLLFVFLLVTSTGEGIMGTLFAPFVRDVLAGSGGEYGVVCSVQAIGGVLGGLVVAGLAQHVSPRRLLGSGAILFGVVDLAIFLYPTLYPAVWPAAAGMVLVGLPGAAVVAGRSTLFQRHTRDAERGRVFSLVLLCQTLALVVGGVGAGVLAEQAGIVPVLAAQGVGYVVAGLLVLVALGPGYARGLSPVSAASAGVVDQEPLR